MTEEALQQLEQVKEHIKRKKIQLPEIVKLKEFKGKLNNSMVFRFCVKYTANHLSEDEI